MSWLQVVPNDRYIVGISRPVSGVEIGYLVHLYQPLIGPLPISLYQTFYQQLSLDHFTSVEGLHRGLMVNMAQPLDVLLKARYQLEAIGLLDTFRLEKNGDYIFEYLLQPPYSPDVFFQDDTLSIMLLNRVGKQHYRNLRRKYASRVPGKEGETRECITRSFDEVFVHLSPSEMRVDPGSETAIFLQEVEREDPLDSFKEGEGRKRTYQQTAIDFELLEALLPRSVKNEKIFNDQLKQVLYELAFLYQLNDQQLAYFLHEPTIYGDDNAIDFHLLRRNVKDWYRQVNSGIAPQIRIKGEENPGGGSSESGKKKKILSREEEHHRLLSSISPLQLLSYYHNGARVAPADQKIVEDLLESYQLPFGVANVLLEYVMLTQDKQLPKALIFKIAAHWKRMNIKTVPEAQELAKQLYAEHKGKKEGKALPRKRRAEKPLQSTNDGIPQHIRDQLEQQKMEDANKPVKDQDFDSKKLDQDIDAMLRAMEEMNKRR